MNINEIFNVCIWSHRHQNFQIIQLSPQLKSLFKESALIWGQTQIWG